MTRRTLHCLPPRVQGTEARIKPHVVERKRGRAGVEDRQRIRKRDRYLCQGCLRKTPPQQRFGTDVDHIVPLHKGGADTDANKELLCEDCHAVKTASDLKG